LKDPASRLRSATRRAKSDVANKLISMCLHEFSRSISLTRKGRKHLEGEAANWERLSQAISRFVRGATEETPA